MKQAQVWEELLELLNHLEHKDFQLVSLKLDANLVSILTWEVKNFCCYAKSIFYTIETEFLNKNVKKNEFMSSQLLTF